MQSTARIDRDFREYQTIRDRFARTWGSENSLIDGRKDEMCKVKSDWQETQRLDVPRCFLDQRSRFITQMVQVDPTELVFNLGTVGVGEWDDRQSENVMIAILMREKTIDHKINKNSKHVSAMT
jgi:hypothetical protein